MFAGPRECGPNVVVVRIQAFEPTIPLAGNGDIGVRRRDQLEVIGEIATAHRIGLIGLGEPFLAVLA